MTLHTDHLVVRHGTVVAVHDVTLDIPRGAVIAVTGDSGSGKTSLLRGLSGRAPRDGVVTLDGARLEPADAALIPQTGGLAGLLTAYENIVHPLLARGLDPTEARNRAGQELGNVGLEGFGHHLIDELSGGQQQRVAVARALACRPGLLLGDEPTSALDPTNRELVLRLLQAHARSGAVVVITSHDPEIVAAADGEFHLDEGVGTWVRPYGEV